MIKKLEDIKKMDLECNVFSIYEMDGKTTQEILNQFFTKINDVIDVTNASISLIEWMINAGLKEDVAKTLIEWVENGTLKEIIDEQVLDEMHEKIDNAVKDVNEQKDRVETMMFQLEDQFEFLKNKEGFNIKFYGAKGNGIDDDTDAIKNALFSMDCEDNSNKKALFVPSGTYMISDSIEIPDDIVIVGEGNSIIKYNANNICLTLGKNNRLENLILDSKDVTVTDAISVTGNNTAMRNIKFKNFVGVDSVLISSNALQGLTIENCIFENVNCSNYIYTENTKKIFIKNNKFESTVENNKAVIIHINEANQPLTVNTDAYIENNYFNCPVKYYIKSNVNGLTVINNSFYNKNVTEINTPIKIEAGKELLLKNNIYKLNSSSRIILPIIEVESSRGIDIINELVNLDGTLSSWEYAVRYPLLIAKDARININAVQIEGAHKTENMFEFANCSNVKVLNIIVDENGEFENIIKATSTTVELLNNNIKVRKGNRLCNIVGDYVTVDNNIFYTATNYDSSIKECVFVEGRAVTIKDNDNLKSVKLKDVESVVVFNNKLTTIEIDSPGFDITSQNNIFDGTINDACYKLNIVDGGKYSLLSRNNFNKSNLRFITFDAKESVLDVSNVDVKTINDMNADSVQEKKHIFINKTANVTVDIYKQCYIQTTQALQGITYHSSEHPQLNVKHAHGAVIYNARTGRSELIVIDDKGINRSIIL